jgi:hypothetical protein
MHATIEKVRWIDTDENGVKNGEQGDAQTTEENVQNKQREAANCQQQSR